MTRDNKSTLDFEEGFILYIPTVDKYTKELKETFSFEGKESKEKFSIKKERLLEIANQFNGSVTTANTLLHHGWKGNEKMSAGAGKALKITLNEEHYEFIFYIGKVGEEFNTEKIERKAPIKFTKKHLESIFTFLKCNDEVEKAKAEEQRLKRTTLDLK